MRRQLLLVCSAVLAASAARAEGPGWKLGDSLVLHPGIYVGAGYDSNVFFGATSGTGGAYFGVRPTVDLSTLSPQRGGSTPHSVDFRVHLGADLRFLFPTQNPQFSTHNSYNVDGSFTLSLFPFGNYAFDLFGNYLRTSQTPYQVCTQPSGGGAPVCSVQGNGNIDNDLGQVGLRLRLRPGGQRLEITVQDVASIYLFESSDASHLFQAKNNFYNDVQLRVSWKFFPKTALYINASDTQYNYYNPPSATSALATPPTAYPLRAVLGVIGLITPTLRLDVNIGYANSFTQQYKDTSLPPTRSYNSVIALVDLNWKPTLVTTLGIGYRHDFAQALIGTYYTLDAPYLTFMQGIWRLSLILRFGYEHRQYAGDLRQDGFDNGHMGNPERVDNYITLHAELNFPIKDWFYISIGDDLYKNVSNCVARNDLGTPPIIDCGYLRNDVWLRVGLNY